MSTIDSEAFKTNSSLVYLKSGKKAVEVLLDRNLKSHSMIHIKWVIAGGFQVNPEVVYLKQKLSWIKKRAGLITFTTVKSLF